jgi:hypothetical protein
LAESAHASLLDRILWIEKLKGRAKIGAAFGD